MKLTYFGVHIHKLTLIFAIGHLCFRLGFVIVDGIVRHYYGILGDLVVATCTLGIIFGHRKEMPTLYLPYIIFSPIYAVARFGMGCWVLVIAIEALNNHKQVETAIGDQYAKIAITAALFQIIGSFAEFFAVKVVYDDYKYLREVVIGKEEKAGYEP